MSIAQALLVPAYIYPTLAGWTQYVNGAPATQIMVANVNSGPGTSVNSDYTTAIAQARAVDAQVANYGSGLYGSGLYSSQARSSPIQVVGYVHTSFGARPLADVEADIDSWYSFYTIDGIFVDEVQGDAPNLSYYRTLFNYIKAKTPQRNVVVLNPGTLPLEDYTAISNVIVLFENNYAGYQSSFTSVVSPSWVKNHPPSQWCSIIYNIPDIPSLASVVSSTKAAGIGYVFLTDQNGYTSAPSSTFWSNELLLTQEGNVMALLPRRHQVLSGATLTASGNSGTLPNLDRSLNPTIVALLDVSGTVSGTSPNLTVTVSGWTDTQRKVVLGTFTAVTATMTAPARLVISNALEDNIEVEWAITGTTPSFGGVSINLLMSSPDA